MERCNIRLGGSLNSHLFFLIILTIFLHYQFNLLCHILNKKGEHTASNTKERKICLSRSRSARDEIHEIWIICKEKIWMRHFWFRKILFSFRPIVLFSITPLVHPFSIISFSLLFYLLVYLHPFSVILAKIVLHVPVKSWKHVLQTNVHHIACHRIASYVMSCSTFNTSWSAYIFIILEE